MDAKKRCVHNFQSTRSRSISISVCSKPNFLLSNDLAANNCENIEFFLEKILQKTAQALVAVYKTWAHEPDHGGSRDQLMMSMGVEAEIRSSPCPSAWWRSGLCHTGVARGCHLASFLSVVSRKPAVTSGHSVSGPHVMKDAGFVVARIMDVEGPHVGEGERLVH